MKLVKKALHLPLMLCLFLLLATGVQESSAQVVDLEIEVYQIHNGVNTPLPEGYVTYRVYAVFTNEDDYLTSIYGIEGEIPWFVEADCGFYQSPVGANFGGQIVCDFIDVFPELEYDSWFTYDRECSSDPGSAVQAAFTNPMDGLAGFEAGNSITINDGALFIPNDGSINAIAGPDLRILIGQFTTCSELCISMNFQTFPGGENPDVFTTEIQACSSIPCVGFEIEQTDLTNISCFGENDGTLTVEEVNDVGEEPLEWDIYEIGDTLNPVIDNNPSGEFTGLGSGSYYVVAVDNAGCIDTASFFDITEPDELLFEAELSQSVLCEGEESGLISLNYSGGTPPYTFNVNGSVVPDNPIELSDLPCGLYSIQVADENNCSVTEEIDIACPPDIVFDPVVTDISCFEECTGSITSLIEGGTGDLTVDIAGPDAYAEQLIGNPVDLQLQDLCDGEYTVTITDTNNCQVEESITIDQPEEFIVTEEHTDVSCFGLCDGTINVNTSGGVEPYDIDFGEFDPLALCGGEYEVLVCDANDCCVTLEIEISEPEEIIADLEFTNVTCPGADDGTITITASGGVPDLTYELAGPINIGPQAEGVFENLPGGDYTISVVDATDCSITLEQTIDAPDDFVLNIESTNLSCFEACDGSISGQISGGTGVLTVTANGPAGFTSEISGENLDYALTDLCAGEYSITLTDENSCVADTSFTIIQPDELIVTEEHTDASCFGFCDGTISLDIQGGTTPYDLDFGGLDPDALCAGTVEVSVSDANECIVNLTVEIVQPEEIITTLIIDDVSCPNLNDASITVNSVGGVPVYSFEISGPVNEGPQAENIFDELEGGDYTLTITDATECSVSQEFNIFSPADFEASLTVIDVTCNGLNNGVIDVSASGGTGELSYLANELPGGPVFTDLAPNDYTITILDENDCTASLDTIITEPPLLEVIETFSQAVGCGGDCDGIAEFEITGGIPDYETDWNGDPFQENDQLCAGTNVLTVTDANECVTTLEVFIETPDPIEIIINENPVTCTGMTDGSASVAVTGGTGEVILDLGELSPADLLELPEGNYIVSATDVTGCFVQDTIMIGAALETDLEIEIFTSPVSCWDEGDGTATAAVTGGSEPISYSWNDPLNQNTAIAVGLEEGVYTVTVSDVIGCTIDTTAIIEPTEGCFFIATVLTPNGDGANDDWVIGGLEYFPDSKVQVYNRWGQLLFESTGYTTRWDGTFGGQRLPTADYYYVIDYASDKEPLTGTVTIKY